MSKQIIIDTLGWGFLLWLIGYVLGFIFFAFVPMWALGWVIMPFALVITLWVLFKKVKARLFQQYLMISAAWIVIAVVFDYLFLVLFLNPEDGYYKVDVYLYYALIFLLPLVVWWIKKPKTIAPPKLPSS